MTNAEKYLKDGVDYIELARQLSDFIYNKSPVKKCVFPDEIVKFFEEPVKLVLTEDERVILRSIDVHTFEEIRRNQCGFLELYDECLNEWIYCQFKDSLFQFIKNGEEYEIAELLKGE